MSFSIAEFVNVEEAQESIPPAYVAWRAGTTTLQRLPESIPGSEYRTMYNTYVQ